MKCTAAAMPHPPNPPIFIHSLPRVGSTWLGYKFADCPNVAYRFEPFHENLIAGTPASLQEIFEKLRFGKSLRHPVRTDHYHKNYSFRPGGGAFHFEKRFCFENYCIDPFAVDDDLRTYFANLLAEASKGHRTPVIKSTKSPFRADWLSKHFPGVHLYIFRNPRLMDNSHFSYRGFSNPYIRDYSLIIGQNGHHSILQELAKWSGLDRFVSGSLKEEYSHYHRVLSQENRRKYDRQYHFDCLCFFWVLALAQSTTYADLIIDMDMLAQEEIRLQVVSKIKNKTGLSLDLSDHNMSNTRLGRIMRRHRLVVSGEMEGIIRRAVDRLKPDWKRLRQFYLTEETKSIVRLFDDQSRRSRKTRHSNRVENSGRSAWHYVFSPK